MSESLGDFSLGELINFIASSRDARIETMLPGRVATFDATTTPPRCSVDLSVKFLRLADNDIDIVSEDPPRIENAPVCYPTGVYRELGYDDEVLVLFASRDCDNAVETGKVQTEPASPRRHHIMDAFVLPLSYSKTPTPSDRQRAGSVGASAHIFGDTGPVQLGAGAVAQLLTTATKVLARLNLLENAFNAHIHNVTGAITGTPTSSVTPTGFGDLEVDDVWVRT